jgi:hypothetical protein
VGAEQVRVDDAGGEAALLPEVADGLGVAAQALVEDFDRDVLLVSRSSARYTAAVAPAPMGASSSKRLPNTRPVSSAMCTSDMYAMRMSGSALARGGVH